jgi:hypothetical protein
MELAMVFRAASARSKRRSVRDMQCSRGGELAPLSSHGLNQTLPKMLHVQSLFAQNASFWRGFFFMRAGLARPVLTAPPNLNRNKTSSFTCRNRANLAPSLRGRIHHEDGDSISRSNASSVPGKRQTATLGSRTAQNPGVNRRSKLTPDWSAPLEVDRIMRRF